MIRSYWFYLKGVIGMAASWGSSAYAIVNEEIANCGSHTAVQHVIEVATPPLTFLGLLLGIAIGLLTFWDKLSKIFLKNK